MEIENYGLRVQNDSLIPSVGLNHENLYNNYASPPIDNIVNLSEGSISHNIDVIEMNNNILYGGENPP